MARPLPALLLALEVMPAASEERFRIAIDLDAEASARLVAMNKWITIEASYCGEVRPGAPEAG